MQQPPTGYGQSPQWNDQQQPFPPNEQWAQQPYQQYPPYQQQQFRPPYTPNQQWNQPHPQPEQPTVKKNISFKVGLIVATVLIVSAVGFAIFQRATGNTISSTNYQTMSESQYKASTTDMTVENIDKDGNNDKGKDVHFLCIIDNFVKDSNGNTAGANVDGNTPPAQLQVVFPDNTKLTKLNAGDTLEVWGVDDGTFSGNNAFGTTVQEVGVSAGYMTDQTTTYETGD